MAPELTYRYAAPSTLVRGDGRVDLGLATSGGDLLDLGLGQPFFFAGFVEHAEVVAQALLVVARTARTRFYVPPNTLAAVLRAADPVVTSTPDGLRFESFSVCCGVQVRLDIDPDALDASFVAPGVTNVDVNPPLRQALATVRAAEPLHLNVGHDGLHVTTLTGETTEEKVTLPERWLRGFGEAQALMADMRPQVELSRSALTTFVQGLPRTSPTRSVSWVTPTVRGARLASAPSAGAVCLAGADRLRVIAPLVRYATALRGYGPQVGTESPGTASAWVLDLPGARLTVGLSPEKSRGFSGEGALLGSLAQEGTASDAAVLSALLAFDPRIDLDALAARAGMARSRVEAGLAVLASSGQVGFDVAKQGYFHRPLPVNSELLDELHPRLAAAHTLVDGQSVTVRPDGVVLVVSGRTAYEVRPGEHVEDDRCTCTWWGKYRGTRGPCKHVLAARIQTGESTP